MYKYHVVKKQNNYDEVKFSNKKKNNTSKLFPFITDPIKTYDTLVNSLPSLLHYLPGCSLSGTLDTAF